jgi:type IV pilus assembly protein PilQ
VNKDEVDFSRTVLGNPTIITKKAETNVIQADGQTLVIGGLGKETDSKDRSGTPGLLDVPVLGWLFKKEGKSNEKEELLIFITPTILNPQASGAAGG